MTLSAANGTGRETRPARDRGRSTAEWVTLGVSLAIVAFLVGTVISVYVAGGDEPATIEVQPLLEDVRSTDGVYYLPVEVTNRGDRTAEDVNVEMSLLTDGAETASAAFTIRFLAGGERQRGVVAFRQDPSAGELQSSISYIEP